MWLICTTCIWPCMTATNIRTLQPTILSDFGPYVGRRVGEASKPGPSPPRYNFLGIGGPVSGQQVDELFHDIDRSIEEEEEFRYGGSDEDMPELGYESEEDSFTSQFAAHEQPSLREADQMASYNEVDPVADAAPDDAADDSEPSITDNGIGQIVRTCFATIVQPRNAWLGISEQQIWHAAEGKYGIATSQGPRKA